MKFINWLKRNEPHYQNRLSHVYLDNHLYRNRRHRLQYPTYMYNES
jgi:hypothetical protein